MYEIVAKKSLNSTVTMMEIKAPLISKNAQPGQFIILRVDEDGERIPLTIFDSHNDTIKIIYQIVGYSTITLNKLQIGDCLHDIVGPLGEATDVKNIKKAIVVGGGVGCAIAYPIAKKLHQLGVDVTSIIGFRNRDLVILENEFKNISNTLIIMTDDGSYGQKGLVTEALKTLLRENKYDKVFAIGPLPMMKYVCLVTKEFNTKTIISMNSIMVDGTGMCGGCRVIVDGKTKFACVDGPDFDGHLVDFDTAIARNNIYRDFEKCQREKACHLLNGDHHE